MLINRCRDQQEINIMEWCTEQIRPKVFATVSYTSTSAAVKVTRMQPNRPTLLLIIETSLFLMGLIITLFLCVPLVIYRQFVKISAKLFQPDLVRIVPLIQSLLAKNENYGEEPQKYCITSKFSSM